MFNVHPFSLPLLSSLALAVVLCYFLIIDYALNRPLHGVFASYGVRNGLQERGNHD